MTVYELIAANQGMLRLMSDASIDVSDLKYIDMYKEYVRLIEEGHKKTYIIQYLSEEYNVGQATLYRIINRFSSQIHI